MTSGAEHGGQRLDLPGVMVVIPTRGLRPALLGRAVAAVLNNGYSGSVSVLVVADGIDTATVLSDLPAGVCVCANERTPGLAGARNTGLLRARTEMVALCDDDDEWLPGKLEDQVRLLGEHPESLAASCGISIVQGPRVTPRRSPPSVSYSDLLRNRIMVLHSSTLLLRRAQLLSAVGVLDERLPGGFAEDYDLLLRVARVSTVVTVPRPLVRVHWHGQSYYFGQWATIAESLAYLLEKYPDFSRSRRGHARIQAQIALALAASGRRRSALRLAGHAFTRWPAERRIVPAVLASLGLVSADTFLRLAHRSGRGL
jgi:glycosyltransferase involved in cell wall biosynthesis